MTFARFDQISRGAVALCLWLVAVTLNMAAVLSLGFQGLKWLHDGYWTAQPTVMYWMHGFCPGLCSSLHNPHSWYGAAKAALAVSQMPTGLALMLAGMTCVILSATVGDHRLEARKVRNSPGTASLWS
ncbi:hypothetical protein [Dyella mobilis]|uniref:Uncharacterized protein n=1 Tax=Dyella mobilis TaxID=1849582 RepID=A0ABS2KJG4_9GAMM|nr:hypothetical protein [Dyella mobilis]MBM7131291.1 hypothetical protein [Dyella mobilis]GLQ98772.1 hypothetical protein GCM10007863_31920 [Dyella mobilis]